MKRIIKLIALFISLIILVSLCVLLLNYNKANIEEMNTPVHIVPTIEKKTPAVIPAVKPSEKPVTRDENNIPKSDYKVPEIG